MDRATTVQLTGADDTPMASSPVATRQSHCNSTIFSLPFHLLCNIFIILPLKAIAQCARVCSTWRTLIHDPSFTHQHLSLYPPTNSLVLLSYGGYRATHTTLRVVARKAIHQMAIPIPQLKFVGSINGLVCLSDYSTKIVLCKPIMGAHLILPDCEGLLYGIGFGYIPSTHQYKIVWITFGRKGRRKCYVGTVNGKGKTICSCKRVPRGYREPVFGDNERSVFYNDAVIWIGDNGRDLVYFDIVNEKFGYTCFPSKKFRGKNSVGVFYYHNKRTSHFYIAEHTTGSYFINIWLTEDYKSINSVELKWVIDPLYPRSWTSYGEKVLAVLKDGRLLICLRGDVACYDTKTRRVTQHIGMSVLKDEVLLDAPSILGCPL